MSPIKTDKTKQLYSELLSLTQLFLLREHRLTEKNPIDRESFLFLKSFMKATQNFATVNKTENGLNNPVLPPLPPPSVPSAFSNKSTLPQAPEAIKPNPTAEIITPPSTPSFPVAPPPHSNPKQEKKGLALEPLNPCVPQPDLSFEAFFKENFPHYPLSRSIPTDHIARKIKDNWQLKHQILPVVILSFNEQKESLTFLKSMAKAISLRLAPACVLSGMQLEKGQEWDSLLNTPDLRLIIVCDYELYLQKNLMKFYKQTPQTNAHFLHQTPLLLLSELSLYLKRPELKSFLWNALCNLLKNPINEIGSNIVNNG